MSSHTPPPDAGCNRAEKDIEITIQSMSAALAGSVFEKVGIADNRLLMQTPSCFITSTGANSGGSIWDMCRDDLAALNGTLTRAMTDAHKAAVNGGVNGGPDAGEYMNQWLAAWVASPVSTRLLRAMQTLLDGCIFQVSSGVVVKELLP